MTADRQRDRHTQRALVVRLPDDLRAQLRDRAAAEERTQTQVVKRALRQYLEEPVTA